MATTKVAVTPMKVAQVPRPGGDFEIVERDVPKPRAGEVRIKVQACGVCHSDQLTKEGLWPGIQYPRVPGHEVAGIIDELGEGVTSWTLNQRVGVGWHGGHDNTCLQCRRGDFRNCQNLKVPGISYDGGYQQYMIAPVEALTPMPQGLSDVEAAPLLCAGITTYNALRHSGAMPGDLVAILGVGGLGHLGIQFANKFGYKVAAIARGQEDASLAKKLGAHVYIDNKATNPAQELQKLGGAQAILATAPSSKSMSEVIDGLAPNGKLIVVGVAFEPIDVAPVQLITGSRSIQGWASGTAADEEDTLRFAELSGVRPMIETYPLEKAGEAYARMISGKAQFRIVIPSGAARARDLVAYGMRRISPVLAAKAPARHFLGGSRRRISPWCLTIFLLVLQKLGLTRSHPLAIIRCTHPIGRKSSTCRRARNIFS